MSVVPVADVLQGRVAVDSEVTVRGWVRTRQLDQLLESL